MSEQPKRRRGRPKKNEVVTASPSPAVPLANPAERPAWLRPVRKVGTKYHTVDQLLAAADEYFSYCYSVGEPYTMAGLALALGITRNCWKNWKKDKPEFYGVIESARQLVEYSLERLLVDPRTKNVAGPIFSLKNNFGWEDRVTHEGDTPQRVTFVMNIGKNDSTPKLTHGKVIDAKPFLLTTSEESEDGTNNITSKVVQ